MTSIPIEWLFGALGTMVGVIYLDLKRDVRGLMRGAVKRDFLLIRICDRLKITFHGDTDND